MGHVPSKELSVMPFQVDLQGRGKGGIDRLTAVAMTQDNFTSRNDPLFQKFVQLRADPSVLHWFNVEDPSDRSQLPPVPSRQALYEQHVTSVTEELATGKMTNPLPLALFRTWRKSPSANRPIKEPSSRRPLHNLREKLSSGKKVDMVGYLECRFNNDSKEDSNNTTPTVSLFLDKSFWNEAKSISIFQIGCKCFEHYSQLQQLGEVGMANNSGSSVPIPWPVNLRANFLDTNLPTLRLFQQIFREYRHDQLVVKVENDHVTLTTDPTIIGGICASLAADVSTETLPPVGGRGSIHHRFSVETQKAYTDGAPPTPLDALVARAKEQWVVSNAVVVAVNGPKPPPGAESGESSMVSPSSDIIQPQQQQQYSKNNMSPSSVSAPIPPPMAAVSLERGAKSPQSFNNALSTFHGLSSSDIISGFSSNQSVTPPAPTPLQGFHSAVLTIPVGSLHQPQQHGGGGCSGSGSGFGQQQVGMGPVLSSSSVSYSSPSQGSTPPSTPIPAAHQQYIGMMIPGNGLIMPQQQQQQQHLQPPAAIIPMAGHNVQFAPTGAQKVALPTPMPQNFTTSTSHPPPSPPMQQFTQAPMQIQRVFPSPTGFAPQGTQQLQQPPATSDTSKPIRCVTLPFQAEVTMLMPTHQPGVLQPVPVLWAETTLPLKLSDPALHQSNPGHQGMLVELMSPPPTGGIQVLGAQGNLMHMAVPNPCYISVKPGTPAFVQY